MDTNAIENPIRPIKLTAVRAREFPQVAGVSRLNSPVVESEEPVASSNMVRLRVALALLVHDNRLRAEAVDGEAPVIRRCRQAACAILTRASVLLERIPARPGPSNGTPRPRWR